MLSQNIPKYSTKHVLCMEFLKGEHIPEWLKTNPNQNPTEPNSAAFI